MHVAEPVHTTTVDDKKRDGCKKDTKRRGVTPSCGTNFGGKKGPDSSQRISSSIITGTNFQFSACDVLQGVLGKGEYHRVPLHNFPWNPRREVDMRGVNQPAGMITKLNPGHLSFDKPSLTQPRKERTVRDKR